MNAKTEFTRGQIAVLVLASTPMALAGAAGAFATFVNMQSVINRSASALGMVAAGEGATLICALIALAVTLMGQHTPGVVRLGMWVIPLAASAAGVALAPTGNEAVVFGFTPMAMTAAGEGIAFVARRVVAYSSGVDLEAQRRSGLLLWHANRAAKGRGPGRWLSRAAVGRLTKAFASTDAQMSLQLDEVQRFRIGENADANLALVLGGSEKPAARPSAALKSVEGPGSPKALPKAAESAVEPIAAPVVADGPAPEWVRTEITRRAEAQDEGFDMAAATHAAMAAELAEIENAVTGGLWTADDVAEFLNCKPSTVRTLVHRDKQFGIAGKVGQRNLYDPAEVRAYANRRDS